MATGTPEGENERAGDESKQSADDARPKKNDSGPGKGTSQQAGTAANRRRLRVGVIVIALLVAVVAWVVSRGGDDSSTAERPEPGAPRIVTESELEEVAETAGQPIYWAGPIAGRGLELIELEEGVRIHYVPEGTEAGAESAASLTVGTYTLTDPNGAIEEVANQPGEIVRELPDGRKVVSSEKVPNNVYFASADNSVQVEIFDPSPKRAMSLALSGDVQPVD